ncbi:MAG: type IV toxin-antitoxin system AbiEi family antitoxin [Rothia sp. (in: high G+C Gram-positive bacteria)]|uniref:type IV toxin-antitoxin system AbiEi family antitoxin n=1 Tax=Rothia sp. (in: high G+C Gram-positive bacteria) TaxID=1885016 RepID=UPI0026E065AF|nr:type IV toxin-antitoxin system AbiEi family antitoxin [Rothia sp. (in: high G+C Gram-positive bacteria)]MDO5749741.1 type IV toxin-antitoxin system AbiEi family antitoxin [Rothia sp. (in: high G+C Gram-positive bacteria)]
MLDEQILIPELERVAQSYNMQVIRDSRGEHRLQLPDKSTLPLDASLAPYTSVSLIDAHRPQRGDNPVYIFERVGSSLASALHEREIQYIDRAGNAWIHTPIFNLWVEGKKHTRAAHPRPRTRTSRTYNRPFTAAHLRVLFVLLAQEPLLQESVRTIARAAGVSAAMVTKTFQVLRAQGFLLESARGRVLEHRTLLRERWVHGYLNTLRPTLEQGKYSGVPIADFAQYAQASQEYRDMLSGEYALEQAGADIRAAEIIAYAEYPPVEIIRALRLVPDSQGKITIIQPFWNQEYIQNIPNILVYADALASADSRVVTAARNFWRQNAEV